jgi:hypothetical protein
MPVKIRRAADIELRDLVAGKNAQVWILNGPGIDATNEKEQTTVRVKHTICMLRHNQNVAFLPLSKCRMVR